MDKMDKENKITLPRETHLSVAKQPFIRRRSRFIARSAVKQFNN
jgi:hypothetical protein